MLEGFGKYLCIYLIDNFCGLCVDNEDRVLVCNGSNWIYVILLEGLLLCLYCVNKYWVMVISVLFNLSLFVGFKKLGIIEVYCYDLYGINDIWYIFIKCKNEDDL